VKQLSSHVELIIAAAVWTELFRQGGHLFMSAQENVTDSQTSQAGPLAETIEVLQGISRVSCDGGGGALGHPVIWLTLTTHPSGGALAVCPYCSRQFVSK
tara:strand:- start:633 stop:932 length:300 start_codon:yes stop_codon:yes gene_type:complete